MGDQSALQLLECRATLAAINTIETTDKTPTVLLSVAQGDGPDTSLKLTPSLLETNAKLLGKGGAEISGTLSGTTNTLQVNGPTEIKGGVVEAKAGMRVGGFLDGAGSAALKVEGHAEIRGTLVSKELRLEDTASEKTLPITYSGTAPATLTFGSTESGTSLYAYGLIESQGNMVCGGGLTVATQVSTRHVVMNNKIYLDYEDR